jgi:hypothetical protein
LVISKSIKSGGGGGELLGIFAVVLGHALLLLNVMFILTINAHVVDYTGVDFELGVLEPSFLSFSWVEGRVA